MSFAPRKKSLAEAIGRRVGKATRAAKNAWVASGKARSSLAEAREMLGVSEDATTAEIESAYRRRMLQAHPDHGGPGGLARALTSARDILIKKI
jgi:hypothetical protein